MSVLIKQGTAGNDNLSISDKDSRSYSYQLYGRDGNDVLAGGQNDDYLSGGTGVDTLIGGAGNDTYSVDSSLDVIIENAGEGTDLVISSVSYILPANVENISLTGKNPLGAAGNASDNILKGNSGSNWLDSKEGNDTLDGGTGSDMLIGGAGNDTYIVDDSADVAIENANEGIDQINSSVTYTLPINVENLSLTGTDSINATGNASNNTLTGNSGKNILDGGAGIDTLIGGAGNDTYTVDDTSDVVTENANEGLDQINSSVSYVLPTNVENLSLTGTDSINATGNAANNILTGNSGNNVLDGGAGIDTLIGGAGDDTYTVGNASDVVTENADEGTDQINSSVSYTLPINVENLSLTGTDSINATGNASNNTLTGNSGNNVLDGGAGIDTLIGGAGDDTYTVGNASDVVTENANEGTDQINSSVTYTLPTNVENLSLTGTDSINATGNASNNTLTGNSGNNVLDGGAGIDTLIGGAGDDTYTVGNASDVVTENANEGTDQINSSVTYTLPGNVENLSLTGADSINATGNAANNILTGNSGNNVLDGGAGIDTLIGGAGDDTYTVGNASDVVTENANEGIDQINSSVTYTLPINVENLSLTGTDSINATGNAANNILTGNSGNNVLDGGAGIDTLIGGAGDDTYTVGNASDVVTENANEGTDQINSSVTYTLPGNVENLSLTGADSINATGNASNNTLTGNSGNNVLDGGAGIDTLIGGAGDDTYTVGNASDVVTENANEGTDQINSSVSYVLPTNVENLSLTGTDSINASGNASNNTLTGNSGNNVLDGGAGIDTLIGGAGDDTYTVGNASDVVTENANQGTDQINSSVTYTLPINVENLSLTGTDSINASGNASNNTLTGNSGNNVLDGGAGIDTLIGGAGDDTYTVDDTSDVVTENANEGTDQINSSVTYTLPGNVENLSLTGTDSINASGNASNNTLTGNSGNNVLDGGAGIDTLIGGAGDDTYTVDNASDVVTENANQGTDQINSSVTYTLPINVENLSLTGTDSINASGNASNNTLTGNSGNNVLDGGAGIDTLIGGAGDDTYTVDNASDVVTENANQGTDQINSSVTYTLPINVENLSLTGTDSINATGNASNNTLTGNSGNNVLDGGDGADSLVAGEGADTINGGSGADTISLTESTPSHDVVMLANLETTDIINGFAPGGISTTDQLIIDFSELEGRGDFVFLGNATSLADASVNPGFATITKATDLAKVAGGANILIANLSTNIADTNTLETALEAHGSLALTVNNAWAVGDTFLAAYDNGSNSYIAKVVVGGNGAQNNQTFASGELTATVLVQLAGIVDVAKLTPGDFDFIA